MQFQLDDHYYRIERLSAIKQMHLSRKLAPLLPPLAPMLRELVGKNLDTLRVLEVAHLADPFCQALAAQSDAAVEEVVALALERVQVQTSATPEVWMPLWNAGAKSACLTELNDFGKLVKVVVRAITFNLSNFMDGLLTSRGESPPPAASSGAPSPVRKIG